MDLEELKADVNIDIAEEIPEEVGIAIALNALRGAIAELEAKYLALRGIRTDPVETTED